MADKKVIRKEADAFWDDEPGKDGDPSILRIL